MSVKTPSPLEVTTLTRLIESWKAYPCLWNRADENYFNKEAKTSALLDLLHVYKEMKEDATLNDLRSKLENLRTSFKREMRKVESSKSTGSGSGNIRLPKLWYYELMEFIKGDSITREGVETMTGSLVDSGDEDSTFGERELESFNCSASQCNSATEGSSTSQPNSAKRTRNSQSMKSKQELQLLENVNKLISKPADDWDAIGRGIGAQIRQLPPEQRPIVQKLISEALFYGQMKELQVTAFVSCERTESPPSRGIYTSEKTSAPSSALVVPDNQKRVYFNRPANTPGTIVFDKPTPRVPQYINSAPVIMKPSSSSCYSVQDVNHNKMLTHKPTPTTAVSVKRNATTNSAPHTLIASRFGPHEIEVHDDLMDEFLRFRSPE